MHFHWINLNIQHAGKTHFTWRSSDNLFVEILYLKDNKEINFSLEITNVTNISYNIDFYFYLLLFFSFCQAITKFVSGPMVKLNSTFLFFFLATAFQYAAANVKQLSWKPWM